MVPLYGLQALDGLTWSYTDCLENPTFAFVAIIRAHYSAEVVPGTSYHLGWL